MLRVRKPTYQKLPEQPGEFFAARIHFSALPQLEYAQGGGQTRVEGAPRFVFSEGLC